MGEDFTTNGNYFQEEMEPGMEKSINQNASRVPKGDLMVL